MNPFAENLTMVRERLGKSQKAVAERLGVSPSLVSKWEKGERKPDAKQIWELGRVYGVSSRFLEKTDHVVNFHPRNQVARGGTEKETLGSALNDATQQIFDLHEVWAMSGDLPQRLPLALEYNEQLLPSLARSVRDYLRLNERITFEELRSALTEHGVQVFEWNLPSKLSGLSYQRDFSVIFLNRSMPREVKLFTLCHELAHLLFDLRGDEETAITEMATRNDPKEKQANLFAAELLMPIDRIREWIAREKDGLRQKRRFLAAVEAFGVSAGALFYRLSRQGVFSYAEKSRFIVEKPREEADPRRARVENIKEQLPSGLLSRVEDLWLQEKISGGKAASLCQASRNEMDLHLLKIDDEEFPILEENPGLDEP